MLIVFCDCLKYTHTKRARNKQIVNFIVRSDTYLNFHHIFIDLVGTFGSIVLLFHNKSHNLKDVCSNPPEYVFLVVIVFLAVFKT